MSKIKALATAAAALVVYAAGTGVASAAIGVDECVGLANNNVVYGQVSGSTQCSGMSQGNTVDGAISVFGNDYAFLDKEENNGDPFEGAIKLTGLGELSGTWAIDLTKLGGLYNDFVIALKPDGGYGYFKVGGTLSGTWSSDTPDSYCATGGQFEGKNCAGFALSHISLYGRLVPNGGGGGKIPEPGSLALLGLGLAGLALARRRKQ
jgi:hypothetical protein